MSVLYSSDVCARPARSVLLSVHALRALPALRALCDARPARSLLSVHAPRALRALCTARPARALLPSPAQPG